ncbi:ABC transporter substrate-binding protein [Arthrobacter sp. UYCu723]
MKLSRLSRLAATAVAIALAASMSACSGGGGGDGGDQIELTFMPYQGMKVVGPIIEKFEAENPNIKIKASDASEQYAETLQTRITGGQTPDIFQIVSANRNSILGGELAVDLSGTDFIKTVDPAFLADYTVGEKVYAITFTAWMGTLIYNKDLVEQAGFTEFPSTIEEYVKLGKALQDNKVVPFLEDQSIPSGSLIALLASGQVGEGEKMSDFSINAKPEAATFSDAWTPALEDWSKIVDSEMLPDATLGIDAEGIKAAFLTGQTAIFRSGNWDLKDLQDSGVNFAVAPFPAASNGVPFINGGGDPPYAISSKSSTEKQEAATKFLSYLAGEEGVSLLVKGQGASSISENFTSDPGEEFRDVYKKYLRTGRSYWIEWSQNSAIMVDTMTTQQQLMIQGKASPAEFTKAMDAAFKK